MCVCVNIANVCENDLYVEWAITKDLPLIPPSLHSSALSFPLSLSLSLSGCKVTAGSRQRVYCCAPPLPLGKREGKEGEEERKQGENEGRRVIERERERENGVREEREEGKEGGRRREERKSQERGE